MYPLIVAAIMMLFFHEKKSGIKIGAILFSIVGAILLSSGGIHLEGGNLVKGLIYSILSVVTYAIYIIGLRSKALEEVESTPLTCYVMGFAAIAFIITGQFTGGITWIPFSEKHLWLHILGIAIPATAISNITLIKSVKLVGATMSSILGILEPITAVLIGIWAFSEPFTAKTAIGLAIIILAACVVILNHRIERKIQAKKQLNK
jgi:drug/metabolite transporter (DMT)-like permease